MNAGCLKHDSMNLDYIKYDENGYPYNGMFPPTEDLLNGNDGYDSVSKSVFFYDYAVQGYNIDFNYKGKHYALMGWMDGVPIALLDADDNELQRFEDPMDAVLHCEIDGRKLLDIMEDFTDIECG